MGSVGTSINTNSIANKTSEPTRVVREAKKTETRLKTWFKENKGHSLIYNAGHNPGDPEGTSRVYVVSRQFSGRGMEMYVSVVSDSDSNKSFGGGTTLVRGSFDVAQRMNSLADWRKWKKR